MPELPVPAPAAQAPPVAPAEPPLTPVGPAPAPAPAPQPQPGTAQQAQTQAQQQPGAQAEPGAQIGLALAPRDTAQEAREFAANRSTGIPPAAWAWFWTSTAILGAVGATRRRRMPAYERCRSYR